MQFINQEAIFLISLILVLFFCSVLYLYIYLSNLLNKQNTADKKILESNIEVDKNKSLHIPNAKNEYEVSDRTAEFKTVEKDLTMEELKIAEELENIEREPIEDFTLLRVMGFFEIQRSAKEIIKWKLLSGTREVLLSSTSNYSSEVTCGKGVEAVLRAVRGATTRPAITIEAVSSRRYKVIIKSGNGKVICESPVLSSKAESERIKNLAYAQINKNKSITSIIKTRVRT